LDENDVIDMIVM